MNDAELPDETVNPWRSCDDWWRAVTLREALDTLNADGDEWAAADLGRYADERELGIEAGLAWGALAAATVVYCDFGVSRGMQVGIDRAVAQCRVVETRYLPEWVEEDK